MEEQLISMVVCYNPTVHIIAIRLNREDKHLEFNRTSTTTTGGERRLNTNVPGRPLGLWKIVLEISEWLVPPKSWIRCKNGFQLFYEYRKRLDSLCYSVSRYVTEKS